MLARPGNNSQSENLVASPERWFRLAGNELRKLKAAAKFCGELFF